MANENGQINRIEETSSNNQPSLADSILDWAIKYARHGWPVFPLHSVRDGVCSCGNPDCGNSRGKHPRTINGHEDATTDEEQIKNWWYGWPESNIGCPAGEKSGYVVLDVDGEEGRKTLEKLGYLKTKIITPVSKTGKGIQFFFEHPGYKVENFAGRLPGIDFRGDGGYVVLPPSRHYLEVEYKWINPYYTPLMDMPRWLTNLIQGDGTQRPPPKILELGEKIKKLRPCFRRFAEEGRRLSDEKGEDHLLRLALVQEAHANRFSRDEIIQLYRKAEDYDDNKTTYQVDKELETIVKHGFMPWTCMAIRQHKGCLGSGCKEYKENVEKELDTSADTDEEISDKELGEDLSLTIKGDDVNKKILCLGLLNTYTNSGQINSSLSGPSSTGKTWLTLETTKYFPSEDIEKIGYASPTSFYYRYGKYDTERHARIINLHQKIVVWLDQPHHKLIEKLRPILSHDEKEISYQVTDKSKSGANRMLNIIINGFFSSVHCSANLKMKGQERTRFMQLTPDTSEETLIKSLKQVNKIEANPEEFKKKIDANPERKKLKSRIRNLKKEKLRNVIIPDKKADKIYEEFTDKRTHLRARHRRDLKNLYGLIRGYALLNFQNRIKQGKDIIASEDDIKAGVNLYENIRESNEAGLPPEVYREFKEIIEPTGGITKKDWQTAHYNKFHDHLSKYRLETMVDALQNVGLIHETRDPADKRRTLYEVIDGEYIPDDGGGDNPSNNEGTTPPINWNIPKCSKCNKPLQDRDEVVHFRGLLSHKRCPL